MQSLQILKIVKMANRTLQVCFVLDCTASMQSWIDAAKDKIVDTIELIQEKYPGFTIEVGFIGYRDFHDSEQFIRIPFTQDIKYLQESIMGIVSDGGDDICEDVAGAYRFAYGLGWTADVRCIFHITDAPNHGMQYHKEDLEDDYPGGHPYISLCSEVRDFALNNINLTVFNINESTEIMYRIMKKIYRNIRPDGFSIVNLRNRKYNVSHTFYSEISRGINNSMCSDPQSP